jgi:hypothetical protein
MSRRRGIVWVFLLLTILVSILVLPTLHGITAYLYALSLEQAWVQADPQTKAELEQHLSLYSTRVIQPVDSDWGRNYVLANGERMIQYRILWDAELDVVYDRSDKIVEIFTSYE